MHRSDGEAHGHPRLDQQGLADQVALIKSRYDLLHPGEAVDIIRGKAKPRGLSVLLTFDDFLEGVENFGTRIQPLMKSRAGR